MQETLILNAPAGEPPAVPRHGRARSELHPLFFIAAIVLLVGVAWLIGRWGDFEPGSEIGYNLGLAGGIMMLLLFLYPLRKHFRPMHGLCPAKYWFALHMAMGVLGPLLILAHSRFEIGSVNAGVAMTSMLLVAGSGIIGRFIYIKIHHGLYGHRSSLDELKAISGLNSRELESKLSFAPKVEARLKTFEASALHLGGSVPARMWRFMVLPLEARWVYRRCAAELKHLYQAHARERGWDQAKTRRRLGAAKQLVWAYLTGVRNVVHFSTYERLFALWHVLHVPLVSLLVLSAIAHVVAVHMY